MKKFISFLLAAVLLVSAVPTVSATNDYRQGTQVVYEATSNEAYTITVPAKLAPGGNGTVTLSGTWADNRIVTVTADQTVTLKNSIKETDTKTLNVNFNGIREAGSNTGSQTFTESVSVADITNALFGTWSGKFFYNVDFETVEPTVPKVASATFDKKLANPGCHPLWHTDSCWVDCEEITIPWNELSNADNESTYGYKAGGVTATAIAEDAFVSCAALKAMVLPSTLVSIGDDALNQENLQSVDFSIATSLTTLGKDSVSCTQMETVDLSNCDNLVTIGNSAFLCGSASTVILDGMNSLQHIEEYAFSYGYCPMDVIIANCPELIDFGDYMFAYNEGEVSVTIRNCPKLISIGENIFRDSPVKSFIISGCPMLTDIGDYALYLDDTWTEFDMRDWSITTLGEWFIEGEALHTIKLPGTIEVINDYAFEGMPALTTIYYDGTIEEWGQISKGTLWKYGIPATEVICNNGVTLIV